MVRVQILIAAFFFAVPAGFCQSEFAPVVQQISPDVRLIRLNPDVSVEQLKGEAALSHLHNLLSRRPEAFVAARKLLLDRGFKPTDKVFVERTIRSVSNRSGGQSSPYRRAQNYSESNSEGEIDFWSYDSGNPGTWEGTIYVEDYSASTASTWDGQIDDSTADHPWLWYDETWQGSGGGPYQVRNLQPPLPGDFLRVADNLKATRADVFRVSFFGWATCWRTYVVGGCSAAAVGCINSGPAWPGCFGAWCTGAEVGGALACYLNN